MSSSILWNDHHRLKGQHALFSPSSPSWIRYDTEKVRSYLQAVEARALGTRLHDYACQSIELGRKLPSRPADTISLYVNDALKLGMTPEQCLYYSQYCYGHADAIKFDRGTLRIHDLKTGSLPGKMDQLMIYDALFCLEYGYDPHSIKHNLRIYQYDDINELTPHPDDIAEYMDQIIKVDEIKTGAMGEANYE